MDSPSYDQPALTQMIAMVKDRIPFSFVRFGKNEAALLNVDPQDTVSLKQAMSVVEAQSTFSVAPSTMVRIIDNIKAAFEHADILGIYIQGGSKRSVSSALKRAYYRVPVKCCLLTNFNLNLDIVHNLHAFVGGHRFVTAISSRNIAPILHRQYGILNVRHLKIPADRRYPTLNDKFERELQGCRVFPDVYTMIEPYLEPRCPGEVFLVAGGVFFKDLCCRIKTLGGIAIDLGVGMDILVGKDPRSAEPAAENTNIDMTPQTHIPCPLHITIRSAKPQRPGDVSIESVTSNEKERRPTSFSMPGHKPGADSPPEPSSASQGRRSSPSSKEPRVVPDRDAAGFVPLKPSVITDMRGPTESGVLDTTNVPKQPQSKTQAKALAATEKLELSSVYSLTPFKIEEKPTICVFTAVTADSMDDLRDSLRPVDLQLMGDLPIDFVCFTNLKEYNPPKGWRKQLVTFEYIKKIKVGSSQRCRLLARSIKIMPQWYFNIYSYSLTIWADANVVWKTSPVEFYTAIKSKATSDRPLFSSFYHCERQSVAEEISFICEKRPEEVYNLWGLFECYRKEKFADRCGLFETCVISREPSAETVALGEKWWTTMVKYALRDQIILPYAVWKFADKVAVVGLRYKWRADGTAHRYLDWEVAPWVQREPHLPMK
jgi:hypothetical protein